MLCVCVLCSLCVCVFRVGGDVCVSSGTDISQDTQSPSANTVTVHSDSCSNNIIVTQDL